VPSTTFLGEQDGQPERELKANLVELFRPDPDVRSAFLVRVRYKGSQYTNVALCLETSREDADLVKALALIFHNMFGAHESLDILFLRPEQLPQISGVAKPFYTSPHPNSQL
jgi:hypothetical protein